MPGIKTICRSSAAAFFASLLFIGMGYAQTSNPPALSFTAPAVTTSAVTTFPGTDSGDQLKSVAQMIRIRENLGMARQIYFVSHNNSDDTHSSQVEALSFRQPDMSQAIKAFYDETIAMGISDKVTTFTASDFGRTLVPNGSGTDHGWGSNFVIGGAVDGDNIYGNIPEAEVNHYKDVGRGQLTPNISVDQFAFSLARWFGLSESEAMEVFPNSLNHDFRELYDMFNSNFS